MDSSMFLCSPDYKLGSVAVPLPAVLTADAAVLRLRPTPGVAASRGWLHSTPHGSTGSGKCCIRLSCRFLSGDF